MVTCTQKETRYDHLLRHSIFFRLLIVTYLTAVLHLVTNVISELKMHEGILSLWRGKCHSGQVSVVWQL